MRAGEWPGDGADARTLLRVEGNDEFAIGEAHYLMGALSAGDCAAAATHLARGRAALARREYHYPYLRQMESALADATRACAAG